MLSLLLHDDVADIDDSRDGDAVKDGEGLPEGDQLWEGDVDSVFVGDTGVADTSFDCVKDLKAEGESVPLVSVAVDVARVRDKSSDTDVDAVTEAGDKVAVLDQDTDGVLLNVTVGDFEAEAG